jgi:type I restriction enzyme S subunit
VVSEVEPGFKMTDIGPLPEEWEVATVGDVAPISKRPRDLKWPTEGDIPFVPMALVPNDGFSAERFEPRSRAQVRSGVFFQNGDVLIARITPCLENGRSGLAVGMPIEWGVATTEVYALCPEGVDPLFLLLFLRAPWVREYLGGKLHGATGRQRLPKSVLLSLLMPLPSLPEQRRIAAVLETIRRAIEATDKVIAAAKELKKSLMRHLFTYGPVPYNQADQVPLKETEIGPMPEGWEVAKLGDVAKTATGGTPDRSKPEYYGGSIAWVKSGELNDSQVRLTGEYLTERGLSQSNAKVFPAGTLLVAMYGATAGKVGLLAINAASNQAVAAVFPGELARSVYLFHALIHRRDALLNERYGGAQPNLGQTVLRSFRFPLPPLAEQDAIASTLQSVDSQIATAHTRKSALESLFKTMLHLLMTGQVRVPVPSEAEGNDWPVLPALSAVGGSEVEREVPDDER